MKHVFCFFFYLAYSLDIIDTACLVRAGSRYICKGTAASIPFMSSRWEGGRRRYWWVSRSSRQTSRNGSRGLFERVAKVQNISVGNDRVFRSIHCWRSTPCHVNMKPQSPCMVRPSGFGFLFHDWSKVCCCNWRKSIPSTEACGSKRFSGTSDFWSPLWSV